MKWVIIETRSHLIHFTKMWKVAWEYCFCSNIYYVRHRGVVVNLAHMHSSTLGLIFASVMTALWWLELLAMGRLKIRPPIPLFFQPQKQSPEVFCKKDVLRNSAKFTGKHLCQSLFFNKIADLACNFVKKETLAQVFSCEFCKISRNTFFIEHLQATASATTL